MRARAQLGGRRAAARQKPRPMFPAVFPSDLCRCRPASGQPWRVPCPPHSSEVAPSRLPLRCPWLVRRHVGAGHTLLLIAHYSAQRCHEARRMRLLFCCPAELLSSDRHSASVAAEAAFTQASHLQLHVRLAQLNAAVDGPAALPATAGISSG